MTTSQRIPAWKKLGLKLKHAEDATDNATTPVNGALQPSKSNENVRLKANEHKSSNIPTDTPIAKKRRIDLSNAITTNGSEANQSPSALKKEIGSKRKRVSFAAETKTEDGDTAISIAPSEYESMNSTYPAAPQNISPQPKKAKKPKTKKPQKPLEQKPHSALQYLIDFNESKSSWKFNKNKETWLLKHIFSVDDIPQSYNKQLGLYIRGLKGESARRRLAQGANESLLKADEELGITMDEVDERKAYKEQARQGFKRDYENFLDSLEKDEEGDSDHQRLLAKRRRAEIVSWAVDVDEGSGQPNGKTEGRSVPSKPNSTTSKDAPKRRKKTRTLAIDISDSSSSSDDSDSDDSDSKASTGQSKRAATNPANPRTRTSESDSSSEIASESTSSSSASSDDESASGERSKNSVITISSGTSGTGATSSDETSGDSDSGTSSSDTSSGDSDGESDSDD